MAASTCHFGDARQTSVLSVRYQEVVHPMARFEVMSVSAMPSGRQSIEYAETVLQRRTSHKSLCRHIIRQAAVSDHMRIDILA
jgi:hypothetical protein